MALTLLIVTGFAILLPYAIYPGIVALLARGRSAPQPKDGFTPLATVLIVAHNEQQAIAEKLRVIRGLDYPADRLHVVVASDGSTDGTVAAVRAVGDSRIRVIDLPERRGKAAAINRVLPYLRGEVVLFTDVRQDIDPSSLRRLAGYFADPDVGCVSGRLVIGEAGDTGDRTNRVGMYWNMEVTLRTMEARLCNTVGATGAIYAVRRRLLGLIPDDTLLDDVVIPMRCIREGARVLYDPEAVAWDTPMDAAQEARRKLRTLGGNYQMLHRPKLYATPTRGAMAWMFFGHKASRLLVPYALVGHFVASALLMGSAAGAVWFGVQCAAYGSAGLCAALRRFGVRVKGLGIPYTVVRMNWTVVAALAAYARGELHGPWQKTEAKSAVAARRAA